MLTRLDLAKVVHPAMFSILVFQLSSLEFILSRINWKSLLVGLLWKIGNPRYIPKSLIFLISNNELHVLAQSSWQFFEKITLDFWKLTFWPDALLNSSKVVRIVSLFFFVALQNSVRSSAKKVRDFRAIPTDGNWEPFLSLNSLVNVSGKPSHANDE